MLNRFISETEDSGSAWKTHLTTNVSLNDIRICFTKNLEVDPKEYEVLRDLLEKTNGEYLTAISALPEDVSSAILFCASKVCNSLDYGLQLLNKNAYILGRSLDTRFSLVLEQDMINRLSLENVTQLMRIPEMQKKRLFYINQALKHLQNAFLDNELYEYALENLLEVEKSDPSDYLTLYLIGMIYLYGAPCLDLPKAESYFRKAGIFSKLETNPNAFKFADIMAAKVLGQNPSIRDNQKMYYVAAESFLQGAIACLIQRKYLEAAELAKMAFDIAPEMHEAAYYASFSNALAGNSEMTLKLLTTLVEKMPIYAVVVACDPIMASQTYVQEWITDLKMNTENEASRVFEEIDGRIMKNSVHQAELQSVRVKLYEADYMDAMEILTSLKYKLVVSLKKESAEYESNKERVSFLKGVILDNNRMALTLKSKGLSLVPDIKEIDTKAADEFDVILSPDYPHPVDQSTLSDKISSLIKAVDKVSDENIREIMVVRANLIRKKAKLEEDRIRVGENMGYVNMIVAGIAPFFGILGGLIGYSLTPETIGNKDEYMAPWINFFIGLAIFSFIFVIIYIIIRVVKKRYNEKSPQEISMDSEVTSLDDYITKFK